MIYRRLGSSGLQVSAISLGSWATFGDRVGYEESKVILAHAYDLGINLFDSAEVYADGQAEATLGVAIEALGWGRETYLLCTKVMWGAGERRPNTWGLSRKHVIEGCSASLKRLRTDHIDLYLCHRPDPNCPLEETVSAMGTLIHQGKILYWGTSEWAAEKVRAAHALSVDLGINPPIVEQPQYNLFERRKVEVEYAPLCQQLGLGLMTWSPLAYGLLSGRTPPAGGRLDDPAYKWLRDELLGDRETSRIDAAEALRDLAAGSETTAARLAVAWCLSNPSVSSTITGASSVRQLTDTLRALELLPLSGDLLAHLDAIFDDSAVGKSRGATATG